MDMQGHPCLGTPTHMCWRLNYWAALTALAISRMANPMWPMTNILETAAWRACVPVTKTVTAALRTSEGVDTYLLRDVRNLPGTLD